MNIKSAEFIKSSTELEQSPDSNLPEYAFIGRSNVGKSSLINAVTGYKKIALISNTPGKTKTINHFLINEEWYLADLPGYGYAKVSKKQRSFFDDMIRKYLLYRPNLAGTFLLIDSRHEPMKNDLEFMEWLGENQVPFIIVFTKMDKLSSSALNKNLLQYKTKLEERWDPLPLIFSTSVVTKAGTEPLLKFIAEANENLKKQ